LLLAQARLLVQSGDPAAALPLFEQARETALQRDSVRDAAVTLGDIIAIDERDTGLTVLRRSEQG
jgi:hypothetical protein